MLHTSRSFARRAAGTTSAMSGGTAGKSSSMAPNSLGLAIQSGDWRDVGTRGEVIENRGPLFFVRSIDRRERQGERISKEILDPMQRY
jgi:hypothetical protein